MKINIDTYAVYIVANKANTVFYVGMTSELEKRILKHKNRTYDGFTAKYKCTKLVYFEQFQRVHDAIEREKQLKAGSRQRKIDLIVSVNPSWSDLSEGWYD